MSSQDEIKIEGEDSSTELRAVIKAKDETIAELKQKLKSLANLGAFATHHHENFTATHASAAGVSAPKKAAVLVEDNNSDAVANEALKDDDSAASWKEKARLARAKLAVAASPFNNKMKEYDQVRMSERNARLSPL